MWDVFYELCLSKNVTPNYVAKELNISPGTISGWKAGKYKPKLEKMQIIADYFGVSVEYLMTGKEKSPDGQSELDEKKSKLLSIVNQLSEEDQEEVLRYALYRASLRNK